MAVPAMANGTGQQPYQRDDRNHGVGIALEGVDHVVPIVQTGVKDLTGDQIDVWRIRVMSGFCGTIRRRHRPGSWMFHP